MKTLLELNNKRGVSTVVAYALLITVTIALSILVGNWLRFYVGSAEVTSECSENVNLVISNYSCSKVSKSVSVVIRNKGLFTTDGFVLRVHDEPGATYGLYTVDPLVAGDGEVIAPSASKTKTFDFSDVQGASGLNDITLVEVQPYLMEDGKKVVCKSTSSQKVICA